MFKFLKATPFDAAFSSANEVRAMRMFGPAKSEGLDISLLFPGYGSKGGHVKYLGSGPIGVIGPIRSGKGVALFVPMCLTWQGPLIALDMKGEIIDLCGKSRLTRGPIYTIWQSHKTRGGKEFPATRFNIFDTIRWETADQEADILLACSSLVHGRQHGIIDEIATMIIYGIVKHLRREGSSITGADIFRTLARNKYGREAEKKQKEKFSNLPWWSFIKATIAKNPTAATWEREEIIDKAHDHAFNRMSVFDDETVASMTSTTDFFIDDWQDHNATLFFTTMPTMYDKYNHLIKAAFDTLTNRTSKNKRKTLILMPERLMIGLARVIEDPEAFAAEGKIIVTSFQSLEHMHETYGRKSGFENACDMIIVLGAHDHKTTDWMSKRIGATIVESSVNRQKKIGERPFLQPDEINGFMKFKDEALVFPKFRKPFGAKKIPYYERAELMRLIEGN